MTKQTTLDTTDHRAVPVRLTLDDALEQAQRIVEATRRIEESATMQYVAAYCKIERESCASADSDSWMR